MQIDLQLLKTRASNDVKFNHYQPSVFWFETIDGFLFPIPLWELNEINGRSLRIDAIVPGTVLTRWIRREMEVQADYTPPLRTA